MFPEFSQESVFWLFGIFVGIFVVTLIIIKLLFSDAAKAKRALRKVPRVKVKDMRLHQTVRVVGKVRYADEPLIAPLSKRPCTFFEVMVEEGRAKGNRVVWEDIFCSTRGRNFFIEDETGRAHVKFEDVEVVINKDSDSHSTWLKKAPENFEAFLNEHGMSSKGRRLEAKALRETPELRRGRSRWSSRSRGAGPG